MRLSWIFIFKHLNKSYWSFSAINSSWHHFLLFLPPILSLLCSFSPFPLCAWAMSAVMLFLFNTPQNSFCLLLVSSTNGPYDEREARMASAAPWVGGTSMAVFTQAPRQHQAACRATLGVLCPKSSSSSHNKSFLWTKLRAEEKRTVNFENQKPPIVSLQF